MKSNELPEIHKKNYHKKGSLKVGKDDIVKDISHSNKRWSPVTCPEDKYHVTCKSKKSSVGNSISIN